MSSKDEFSRMEKSDRPISTKSYYGVSSVLLLVGSLVILKFSWDILYVAISCVFVAPDNFAADMHSGGILGACGMLVLILALACAGASLATGQQSILGALVIGVAMLPFIVFLGSIMIGTPIDLSTIGSGNPATSTAQSLRSQC